MVSRLIECANKKLADCPKWLPNNLHYEVIMGSMAYGVSNDASDMDIYGWAIPPKEMVFPHLAGEIEGFGISCPRFQQYQQHHIKSGDTEYDFSIYNIVKYFNLVTDNNPNMIDSLFVPERCVLHITRVGDIVRANRHHFLHKGCWPKFKGYSYAQLTKIENGANRSNPKRKDSYEKFGYDVKFAYHIVRLLNEVEQILMYEDLDLEKNNEHLKSVRRGEIPLDELKKWFYAKEAALETIHANSKLRNEPDMEFIKELLLMCLEDHYGSLEKAVVVEKNYNMMGEEIRAVLERYGV
jgi:predicted nucleotidyltransferase